MRICKYCNKPIAEKDIWNPDNDGNGYHHKCLIDMQFKARDRQIYDKGKMDVLDKIRTEIKEHADRLKDSLYGDGMRHCIDIIDKYRGSEKE